MVAERDSEGCDRDGKAKGLEMTDAEKCPHCGGWFTVRERPMGVPGGQDREPINCAHCKRVVRSEMTDGFWDTELAQPPGNSA